MSKVAVVMILAKTFSGIKFHLQAQIYIHIVNDLFCYSNDKFKLTNCVPLGSSSIFFVIMFLNIILRGGESYLKVGARSIAK